MTVEAICADVVGLTHMPSSNIVEVMHKRLRPVGEAIRLYDAERPLNGAARSYAGVALAWDILKLEHLELVKARSIADKIPPEQLNGQRNEVALELGDVAFGLAEVLKHLTLGDMSANQRAYVGGICNYAGETEQRYGLNVVEMGVRVNQVKNHQNNPTVFYRDSHPLDRSTITQDKLELVRLGLRQIRNMDPKGLLMPDNLDFSLNYYGYTLNALQDSPPLATAFLRQVVKFGLVR